MTSPWRLFACAAALSIITQTAAVAQTVIVRNVPAGGMVELVVNTTAAGAGAADQTGDARVPFDLQAATGRTETEAYVFLDACGATWRVLLVEAPVQPPAAEAGCERRPIAGLFVVRPVSTIIVDAGPTVPTLILRQGSVNLNMLGVALTPPTGLMVFAGAGYGQTGHVQDVACGNLAQCSARQFRPGLSAGVLYWITPSLGAEVAYVRSQTVTASGGLDRFTFDSALDARVLTIAGKFGGAAGRARIYGQGGLNYHEAAFTTTQRVEPLTQTGADDTTAVLPGGTWASGTTTKGWSWMAGGGVETWMSRRLAIYAEGTWMPLKGSSKDGSETRLDDRLFSFRGGVRFRLGG